MIYQQPEPDDLDQEMTPEEFFALTGIVLPPHDHLQFIEELMQRMLDMLDDDPPSPATVGLVA